MSKRLTAEIERLQKRVDELMQRVAALEAARKPGRPFKTSETSEAA